MGTSAKTTFSASVRVNEETKLYFDTTLNNVEELNSDIKNKREALKYVLDVFNDKKIISDVIEIDTGIALVINTIDCKYIRFEGTDMGFVCNEFLYKTKKGKSLGSLNELVIQRCMDCKQGKEDERQRRIDLFLQKDSMKKILNLRAVLMRYVDRGFDVQIFMCKAPLLQESSIKVSYDGKRMPCYQQEDEILEIKEHCQTVINPLTNNPPCEYLIDLFHRPVMREFDEAVKEFAEALPQLEAPLTDEESTTPTQEIKEAENVEVSASDTSQLDEPIEPIEAPTTEKKDKKKEKK